MNKLKIKHETIWNFTIILVNIFVFFGYLIPQRTAFLLATAMLSCIIYIGINKKIYIVAIKENILWIILLGIFLITLLYTVDLANSVKFILTYGSTLIMKIIYDSVEIYLPKYNWKKTFLKVALACSGIHVVCTLLYNFYPNLILKFNRIILNSGQYAKNLIQHNQGLNPGICDDYGFNAFCNLMFVGLVISKCFSNQKFTIPVILGLIGGILALLIIGKRGHLVCFAVVTVICFLLSFNKTSVYKKIFIIMGTGVLILVMYKVALMVPATSILIERLDQSKTTSGLLNGREIIYQHSIDTFKEHNLMGIGIRGIYSKYNGDGHNIYLQLLAELGILGASIVFITILYNIVKSFQLYMGQKAEQGKYYLLFAIFVQLFFVINGITENSFYVESILIFYMIITSFNVGGVKYERID